MTAPLAAAPAVTVVIATLDRRAWLAEAVESVRRQRGVLWELIVVNSTQDDTLEWLRRLSDPRIRGLQLPSPTERSIARNHGLAAVSSPFVMFLDDDDTLEDLSLVVLTRAMLASPEAVAAVGAPRRPSAAATDAACVRRLSLRVVGGLGPKRVSDRRRPASWRVRPLALDGGGSRPLAARLAVGPDRAAAGDRHDVSHPRAPVPARQSRPPSRDGREACHPAAAAARPPARSGDSPVGRARHRSRRRDAGRSPTSRARSDRPCSRPAAAAILLTAHRSLDRAAPRLRRLGQRAASISLIFPEPNIYPRGS
jgi:hypothetical protein